MKLSWIGLLAALIVGCSITPRRPSSTSAAIEKLPEQLPQKTASELPEKEKQIDQDLIEANADLAEDSESVAQIPIEINQKVHQWIRFFSTSHREVFQRFIHRGSNYKDVLQQALKENGMPPDLFYVAMIESGFVPDATSHVRAVGVWQFMPRTGSYYGLTIGPDVDERRDPIRATHAASRYFTDLHNIFESWYLAIAAYNAGEYRIINAIKRAKTRNFWELVRRKMLPKETMEYVPKFLAAVIINRNPKKYGFEVGQADQVFPEFEYASVPPHVPLQEIARVSSIPFSTLRRLNPHLYRAKTPGGGTYQVTVPKGQAFVFKRGDIQKELIAAQRIPAPIRRAPARVAAAKRDHIVKKGESLTSIARKYKTSVAALRKANKLKSNRIQVGMRLVVRQIPKKAIKTHRVRPGETLFGIARKYGLSISELRSVNRLKGSHVRSGQNLQIIAERM